MNYNVSPLFLVKVVLAILAVAFAYVFCGDVFTEDDSEQLIGSAAFGLALLAVII